MICSKFRNKVKQLLADFDKYIEENIDDALEVVTAIKNIVGSPVVEVLVAITPTRLDEIAREKLLQGLNNALNYLGILNKCKNCSSLSEKVQCFVAELGKLNPNERDAMLLKLASLLAGELDGNRLKQNLYDLYTQAKFSLQKK